MTETRLTGLLIKTGSIPTNAIVNFAGAVTASLPTGTVSSSVQVTAFLPTGAVSSSAQVKSLLPDGTVSSSIQINTGSFTGSFVGDGSALTGIASSLTFSGSTGGDTVNLKTETLNILGSNGITTTVTDNTLTVNLPTNTVTSSAQVKEFLPTDAVSSSTQVTAFLPTGTVSASNQVSYTGLSNIPTGIVSSSGQVTTLLPTGTVSSSAQIPVRTFTVTNSGPSAYIIDGVSNATLTLIRGFTYNFSVNASGHPFWIQTVAGAYSSGNIYSTGITNGGAAVGTITFTVPYDAPNTLYYVCQFHSSMAGTINIKDVQPSGLVSSSGQITLSDISGTTFSNNNFTFPLNVNINGVLTATSQSVSYVSSSQLNVGSNDIILNTSEQLRYGGLTVFDSGSANQSGSLFWDSLHNVWLYIHAGTSNTSSILITGPENTGTLGSEQFLTPNLLPKAGLVGDHIVDSQISDNGTTVGMTGNLAVTGSITAASVTASVSGALTGTLQTAAQTNITSVGTLSSLTVSGNVTVDTNTLFVDSVNNAVGVGTTNPNSYSKFAVAGAVSIISGNPLYLWDATNSNAPGISATGDAIKFVNSAGTTEWMRINNTGLGIGTTAPLQKLHVIGAVIGGATSTTGVPNPTGITTQLAFEARSTQAGNEPSIVFHKENVYTFYLQGQNSQRGLRLYGPTNETAPGLFVDGNVGIGTTSALAKLYVEGGSANWNETTPGQTVGTIHLDPGATTDNFGNAITFGASDTGDGQSAQAGIYIRSDGSYGTRMYFATTDSYVSGSKTRMYISDGGKVGIGTTSPDTPLHVQGNLTAGDKGYYNYYFNLNEPNGYNIRLYGSIWGADGGLIKVDANNLQIEAARYSDGSYNSFAYLVVNGGGAGSGIQLGGYSGTEYRYGEIGFNTSNRTIIIGAQAGSGGSYDRMLFPFTGATVSYRSFVPNADNTHTSGESGRRWSAVWAATGTIQTSDARDKTAVVQLTSVELSAAKALAKEIGTFKWLHAIQQKGEDNARIHIGITVQRAMEIMESFGLDPFRYGFICYDEMEERIDIEQAVYDQRTKELISPEKQTVVPAHTKYSFRTDQLLTFVARGFEARLQDIETRLATL